MFNDKRRAFYNSALQIVLGPLPEKETIAFIKSRFKTANVTIENSVIKQIIDEADNIPHYIQLLCAELWQQIMPNKKVVTKDDVNIVAKRVVAAKSDYYMELFDRQSVSKKQLLVALSHGGKSVFSVEYIRTNRLPAVGTIQRAMKGLLLDGIIERKGNEYFIADPFFRRFVYENR